MKCSNWDCEYDLDEYDTKTGLCLNCTQDAIEDREMARVEDLYAERDEAGLG
jgi:hypothetical protein